MTRPEGEAHTNAGSERGRGPLIYMLPAVREEPQTGGEMYSNHVLRAMRRERECVTLTYADIGLDNRAPSSDFAEACLRALAERKLHQGIILQDTILYRVGAETNRRLRRAEFGPIIGLGQAVYPDRAPSRVGKLARYWYFRRYLARLDGHIVVSRYMADVNRRLRVRGPVRVVYPGFDAFPTPSSRRSKQGERLRVITAGAYIPAKGQHLLVDAVAALREESTEAAPLVEVECYGNQDINRPYFDSVRARVADLGLGALVRLHGPVPQGELHRAFGASDLFVFPSEGEGLGMVVVEAMLAGCVPVVAHDGPMHELVDDGRTGVFSAREPRALARAIAALAGDRPRLSRLSEAAAAAAKSFAKPWDETETRFCKAIDDLTVGGGVPGRI